MSDMSINPKRCWLVVKRERVISDGIPTEDWLTEYEGVYADYSEAIQVAFELLDTMHPHEDYYYDNGNGFGAQRRINDEYVDSVEYVVEPVNSYM